MATVGYTPVYSVSVQDMGKLTFISEMSYTHEEYNEDWRWSVVATMMLTLDKVVHLPSLREALTRTLPKWAVTNMQETRTGILIPVRYENSIRDIQNLLSSWAERIYLSYKAIREERSRWPKGADIGNGMSAYRTLNGQVVIFVHVPLYDKYGSNVKVKEMSIEEVRVTSYLTGTQLQALPTEWCIPLNFFD